MATIVSSSSQISKHKARYAEVKAVPGSGKTYTLIQRLKYWADIGVPAGRILVLSHSQETVAELKQRIKSVSVNGAGTSRAVGNARSLDAYLSHVTVQTAHGFANGLIPLQEVLSDKAAIVLLRKAIRAVQRDCRGGELWPDVSPSIKKLWLDRLSVLAEAENLDHVLKFLTMLRASRTTVRQTVLTAQFADLAAYVKVLHEVRRRYATVKKESGTIDFGDMLLQGTNAITNGAPVPYTHILVDEYQDCSPAQVHLLAEIAKLNRRTIMVFGDPNQAIYGFGGGRYTPLSSVLDGVTDLGIRRSRRLTRPIAALASAIAQHSPEQVIQTNRDGEMPVLVSTDTETEQISHVARDIKRLIDGGAQPEQIVLLARTKALLNPVEQTLLAGGVQTNRKGIVRDRKHLMHVLHLVHLVARCERRGQVATPKMLVKEFASLASVDNSRLTRASAELKKVSISPSFDGRYRLCAKVYLRLLGGMRENAEVMAEVNRWDMPSRGHSDARAMRDAVRAMDKAAVVTGTIHSAKGGEWKHVFIVGVTDGYLPFHKARDSEQSLVEERNLLYVAVTRARDTVRLYHSPANHARSRQRFDSPSRFLDQRVLKTLRVE